MFFFNQKAAEARPLKRAIWRTELDIKIHGYQLAEQRGRDLVVTAQPKLQQLYDKTLAAEAAAGQSRVDAMLASLDARVAAV